MEIKELSLIKNLSQEGQKTSAMNNVIGGHGYGHSYSYSYSYSYHGYGYHGYGYFPHPFFEKGKGKKVKPDGKAFAPYFWGPGVGVPK